MERALRRINATVDIVRTQNSVVDPRHLLNIAAFNLQRVQAMDPGFLTTSYGIQTMDPAVSEAASTGPGDTRCCQGRR